MTPTDFTEYGPAGIVAAGTPPPCPPSFTFSTLPGTPAAGSVVYVTDSNTATFNATITAGGGSNKVLALFNGTVWVCH